MKLLSVMNKYFPQKENKPKIGIILLLAGFLILTFSSLFPMEKKETSVNERGNIYEQKKSEEKRLEQILSKIDGIKSVTVLISYENTGTIIPVTEEKRVNENDRESVPIFDGNKNIVVKTEYTPKVSGVCVFYSGIKSEDTEQKLYKGVKGALGIELHKAEVIHISN